MLLYPDEKNISLWNIIFEVLNAKSRLILSALSVDVEIVSNI